MQLKFPNKKHAFIGLADLCLALEEKVEFPKTAMRKYDAPATFFVPADMIGKSSYYRDDLASVFLYTKKLPKKLAIDIGENSFWGRE